MSLHSFSQYGLSTTEQSILVYLLKTRMSAPATIARGTHIKRTTVYAALARLLKEGFVAKHKQNKITMFSALSPESIGQIIRNQAAQKYEDVCHETKRLEQNLKTISENSKYIAHDFQIESVESYDAIYEWLDAGLTMNSFVALFDPQYVCADKNGRRIVENFLQNSAKRQTHIREILVDGESTSWYQDKIQNPHHLTKVISSHHILPSDMIIGDKVVFALHYNQQASVGIRIQQKDYCQSMMTIFEMLWNTL